MIDFRYHLVSIVAVFLALAIGIVLGSTELRGAALSALDRTSNALSQKLDAANNENSALQQEVSGDQAFAQAAEPVLLSHLLDGKRAVVITAPGRPVPCRQRHRRRPWRQSQRSAVRSPCRPSSPTPAPAT